VAKSAPKDPLSQSGSNVIFKLVTDTRSLPTPPPPSPHGRSTCTGPCAVPFLLDDADVLPLRALALCHYAITISSLYHKTTFGKVWGQSVGRVGPWPKLARLFVLKLRKLANLHELTRTYFLKTLN